LARLPLICKGCGQRLAVPGPGETVRPTRKARPQPVAEEPADEPDPEGVAPPDESAGPAADGSDAEEPAFDDFNLDTSEADEEPPGDEDPDEDDGWGDEPDEDAGDEEPAGGEPEGEEPPIFLSDEVKGELDLKPDRPPTGGKAPPPPPPPVPPPPGQRALWLAADVAVGLVLAALGAFLGEFATRKSTGAILREAGSAPKFPPTDLLLWLGCVAMPVMAYVLLANRGKSLGGWLRRRAGG
jgi:hypothetical protein